MKFYCPDCKVYFVKKGKNSSCPKCKREVLFVDEVYDFIKKKTYYWGELSPSEMDRFLLDSEASGWKETVKKIGLKKYGFDQHVIGYGRADWLVHGNSLENRQRCLDIGSGFGGVAFELARFYKEVYSLESVSARIKFQAIRKKQDKVGNITLIRSTWFYLPFPDKFFDSVVMSGVFEWVGISKLDEAPRELQLQVLREIKRVLKDDGVLYTGIENRFGWHYFLGVLDHAGYKYTSILPRWMANLVVRFNRKRGYDSESRNDRDIAEYRTYTFSYWGYKKLYKEAGFSHTDLFWTLFYSSPKFGGRFENNSFTHFVKWSNSMVGNNKVVKRFIIFLFSIMPTQLSSLLVKFFIPCFFIYSYKEKANDSIETLIKKKYPSYDSILRVSGASVLKSKIYFFLYKKNQLTKIVKIPRPYTAFEELNKEENLLEKFNPLKISRTTLGSVAAYVEKPVVGEQFDIYNTEHNEIAVNWLIQFQQKTRMKIMEEEYDLIAKTIKSLPLQKQTEKFALSSITAFRELAQKEKVFAVAEHGDFCPVNLLFKSSKKLVVIDWELYRDVGNPFFDFGSFILNCATFAGRDSFVANFNNNGPYSKILSNNVEVFSRATGYSREIIMKSIPYTMFRTIQSSYLHDDLRQFDQSYQLDYLELLSKTVLNDSK